MKNPRINIDIAICDIPIIIVIYYNRDWWLEIHDRSMNKKLISTPSWNTCADAICRLLDMAESEVNNEDGIKIDKGCIEPLLERVKAMISINLLSHLILKIMLNKKSLFVESEKIRYRLNLLVSKYLNQDKGGGAYILYMGQPNQKDYISALYTERWIQ